ncbi:MAG: carboxy-S-adenosyl-L-methionine synthase CmoA [Alphaproteobacteria bacterium]|jgi:tRNA (cmo5U34)-methyltransferase
MTKPKDNVFDFKDKKVEDFKFNTQVVSVFDDMVTRSVPYYEEMQRMISELAKDFVSPNSNVYDIGCSTATTFCLLDKVITEPNVNFIGYDNSNEMIKKAKQKLKENGVERQVSFECADLNKNSLRIENASLITFILTLQFIRPLNREKIMKQIFDGLNDNGALILVEKVTSEDTIFNRLFINHYYDFKRRNGYSEMEIANKREALENVLIPYRMEENFDLLKNAGFKQIEVFFRWYNFCAIIAVK